MNKELVALVLAGGEGKRFWPLSTNKVLFPFFGKPLLNFSAIDVLPAEVTRVVVVVSPQNIEEVKKLKFPVPMKMVVQNLPDGMAGAILSAKSEIENCELFVINGDDVNDPGMYNEVVNQARKSDLFSVIPGWHTDRYRPLGYLALQGNKITGIAEKPGDGNEPSRFAYTVGYFIKDSDVFLRTLGQTTSKRDDEHELALSSLMAREHFAMYENRGGFATLKYPWHVLDVMDELFKRLGEHRGKDIEIKSNVTIEGKVYIEDGVKIFENTKIVGPVYIGRGAIIGNNNMIRQSHIGAGTVTGFSTDITRSYIGENCWMHSNYIGDSVIDGNVSLGGGTVTANLRLDDGEIHTQVNGGRVNSGRTKFGAIIGKNVRIGANVSMMPGVKIGANSAIGAGVVINKDIPEETLCTGVTTLEMKKNPLRMAGAEGRENFKAKI